MRTVQIIDRHWLHLGGAMSKKEKFKDKAKFYKQIFQAMDEGTLLTDIK